MLSICLILLHAAAVASIFTGVKYLSQSLRSVEIVLLYKSILLICLIPWVLHKGFRIIYTSHTGLLVLRGLLTATGSLAFMYALQHVNIVNATALGYLEQIFWIFIGILFFNERITKIKLIAIISSLTGAFLILSPDILSANADQKFHFNPYYFFVFLAVSCWGSNVGVIKKIGKLIKVEVQLIYSMFFSVLVSSLVALFNWRYCNIEPFSIPLPTSFRGLNPELFYWNNFKYIMLITIAYFTHSIAFFFAVRGADFSLLMPYDYFRLIFIGILNYVIFSDLENLSAWLGYAFIILSGLMLARSEYLKKEKRSN
ncbi:MAG: DMT family transporter [Candidatus Midichloria sp.]|nr:MAG: DMT family transporter [Candidatus Midichloria sp.]